MPRLSDNDLATLEARLAQVADDSKVAPQARTDLQALLDELHELRSREAALLEIARSVAAMPHIARGKRSLCVACGRDADNHRPDCFREKARTLLDVAPLPTAR